MSFSEGMIVRRKIFAANWKMHKTREEVFTFFHNFSVLIKSTPNSSFDKVELMIAPSFIHLDTCLEASKIESVTPFKILAQNFNAQPKGAFTGEVSIPMLKDIGIKGGLLGHSERRQYYAETDSTIHAKLQEALKQNFAVMLCIGETREERESSQTKNVLKKQLEIALKDLKVDDSLMLAYEPVWAIGTGLVASTEQIQDAHQFLRSTLAEMFGSELSNKVRILYGGSVKPENANQILKLKDVDGALIGGASLEAKDFLSIIKEAL